MPTRDEVKWILEKFSGDFTLPVSLRERNLNEDFRTLRFYEITGTQEALRCCFPIKNDLQSGVICCGDLASYGVPGLQPLALCEKHPPRRISNT